jgi:COP9 signalosome complex subunit 4
MTITLESIIAAPQKDRGTLFNTYTLSLLNPLAIQPLTDLISHFINDQPSIVASRALLTSLFALFTRIPNLDPIWEYALTQTTGKTAFEEAETTIRMALADIYQEDERWVDAARVLQGIPLDSGHRQVADVFKCEVRGGAVVNRVRYTFESRVCFSRRRIPRRLR